MPVGFNKARGKLSPARVHGSLGLLPWMALTPEARVLGLTHSWENFLGGEGLTPVGHCFPGS